MEVNFHTFWFYSFNGSWPLAKCIHISQIQLLHIYMFFLLLTTLVHGWDVLVRSFISPSYICIQIPKLQLYLIKKKGGGERYYFIESKGTMIVIYLSISKFTICKYKFIETLTLQTLIGLRAFIRTLFILKPFSTCEWQKWVQATDL